MNERTCMKPGDGWLLLALAGWSVFCFFNDGGTAYEWPALDIAPLAARKLDSTFLANDFFTNASAEANPRHVFGFLVAAVARAFGGDWYAALFLLRMIVVVFLPVLWYLTLVGFARKWLPRDVRADNEAAATARTLASVVIFVGMLLVMRPKLAGWFSIAWWSPFQTQATAANFSLLAALAGSVLLQSCTQGQQRLRAVSGLTSWMLASFLHPAISLFVMAFHGIATFDSWRVIRAIAVLAVAWVLPCAVVALACRPAVAISTEQFIREYVIVRHPSHYWPAAFGSLTGKPWWHSFYIVTGLMLSAVGYAALRRDRRLAVLGLLMAGTYVGAVGMQYVAVVVWPNKFLAALGPVRYSTLGFFAYLLLAAIVVADMVDWVASRRSQWRDGSEQRVWCKVGLPRGWTMLLVAVAAVQLGIVGRDDPFARQREERGNILAWLSIETPSDVVVAVADDLVALDVVMVSERATLVGVGFPFREDFFAEHTFREELLFGTPEARAALQKKPGDDGRISHFRQLHPADFVRIAGQRQLDYVIVEAEHAAAFGTIEPAFADRRWRVYSIASLR